MSQIQCQHCQGGIAPKVHPYPMKVEFYPRVEESLTISAEDLAADHTTAMEKLIEQMEAMTGAEVRREEERIYTRLEFVLCPRCRDELVGQMRRFLAARQSA